MIDTQILHERILDRAPAFVAELFGDEAKRAGEGKWRVGRRGSLAIGQREGRLVFFSHEDGGKGDAVALWQRQRGGTAGDALQACAAWAGVVPQAKSESTAPRARRPRRARVAPPVEPVRYLAPEEFAEAVEGSIRLAQSSPLIGKIAASRADCGWKPEIIEQLAREGVLGWSPTWVKTDPETGRMYPVHLGAVTFHYESGIKHRWRKRSDPPGKKRVAWKCGNGRTLWRSERLTPDTRTVWVCEGEPDVITMLSTGWERTPGEAVLALSSATGIPPNIAELLAGRDVVIVPDQDEPGSRAAEKLIARIGATAGNIKLWKL